MNSATLTALLKYGYIEEALFPPPDVQKVDVRHNGVQVGLA